MKTTLYAVEERWNSKKLRMASVRVKPTKNGFLSVTPNGSGLAFGYRRRFGKGVYAESPLGAIALAREGAKRGITQALEEVERLTKFLSRLDLLEDVERTVEFMEADATES